LLPPLDRLQTVAAAIAVARDGREEGDSAAANHTVCRAFVDKNARPHAHAAPTQRRAPGVYLAALVALRPILLVALLLLLLLPSSFFFTFYFSFSSFS
jgi:hypothetical protein